MSTSGLYIHVLSSACTCTQTYTGINTHTNEKRCDISFQDLQDHAAMLQVSEALRSDQQAQAVCAWGRMSSSGLHLNGRTKRPERQASCWKKQVPLSSSISILRCSSWPSSRPLYWIQSMTAYNPWTYLMDLLLIWTSGDNKRCLTENPIKYSKDCKG